LNFKDFFTNLQNIPIGKNGEGFLERELLPNSV
jgi:hypothetical protein